MNELEKMRILLKDKGNKKKMVEAVVREMKTYRSLKIYSWRFPLSFGRTAIYSIESRFLGKIRNTLIAISLSGF